MRYLLALMVLAAPLRAQETVDRPSLPPIGEVIQRAEQGVDTARATVDDTPIDLDTPCNEIDDDETRDLCWQAFQARLRYYESGLEHRARVFAWQHFSTRVIFFVVLGLVVVGVVFAWLQFRRGMKEPPAAGQPDHELELSAKGIKVSSPVLGVVILALSLAFFYLYLVYVYPITEIF